MHLEVWSKYYDANKFYIINQNISTKWIIYFFSQSIATQMGNVFELNVHLVMKETINQIAVLFQNVHLNIQVSALTSIYD